MPEIGNYSARLPLPFAIERGRANLLQCPVYRNGALSAPTSGTFTLRDPGGVEIVSAGAVTVTGSIAERSIASALLTGSPYGAGWTTEWALLMGDSVVHTFRCGAQLVRVAPHPVVTDADLFRRSSALNPSGAAPITSLSHFQDYIDEAWVEISRRLLEGGHRPWLVVDSTELREPHLLLSLALIYEDLATRLSSAYLEQGKMFRGQYRDAWSSVRLTVDRSDGTTGVSGDPKRGSQAGGWWLGRG